MNKKISAVVTLVGLILIMCAMAVLFHNKKEDNLAAGLSMGGYGAKIIQHSSVKSERKNRRKQFKNFRCGKRFEQGFESI